MAIWGHRRTESDTSGTHSGTLRTDEETKQHFGDIGWHFGTYEGTMWHLGDIKCHFGDTEGHNVAIWGQIRA